MGAADLIPGISGGTVAFILGFYHPLLESLKTLNGAALKSLVKGQWRAFSQRVAWRFLLPLVAGIVCSLATLANFFHFILGQEVYRTYLYAIFLGLILASFVFCIRQIQRWTWKSVGGFLLGALCAYVLTDSTLIAPHEGEYAVKVHLESVQTQISVRNYAPHQQLLTGLTPQMLSALVAQGGVPETARVYDQHFVDLGEAKEFLVPRSALYFNGWLILCGALAICALLLPGISGSYVLTLLGVYPLVIESLVDFLNGLKALQFNGEAFIVLGNLALGIGMGALGFARVLSWLLRCYPNPTLAALSGVMIGAIRSVWPFWTYTYAFLPLKLEKGAQLVALQPFIPVWNNPLCWQAGMCTVAGFLLVLGLEALARRKPVLNAS
jgi:putative membrane protein